ncbi:MAG TPA: alpha/beta hydrolase [Burkholderiales bacterium]|nr:alpha/beta hydrolase [Burkholderiales bacterium]
MADPAPFFREAGDGPGVVCLHSNASTSSQWRALMDALSPRFRVIAPDGYGAGKSPPWPTDRTITLHDEAALLEPVFGRAGDPFSLVGHSYGAAVALIAALTHPKCVRAMALYEPTLFSLVDAESPPPNDADGIKSAVARAVSALEQGDEYRAAGHFIDFWMGEGSWARTPENRKGPIAVAGRNIRGWAHSLTRERTPLEAFAALEVPVLYMVGKKSPASSRAVARILTRVLPRVEVVEFGDLGHMAPITHGEIVNREIVRFLDRG